uniref:acyl-CoA synthetase short-chain family member 3, mitochondrial isoform X2 n=1 Tax=Ciona intestinalis TaxID=7719 RepID=UPI00089DD5C7|nr:acyl-CoA synthetase short-chain family member 3, mitochondrial isoform X2 [Ciona intestinalis]|eukprot:XP_018671713.1 acyl-CoA synthetase short-chain family member 3, mitochondrial isoform X2 [Ciona intestinalis]
MLRTLSTKYHQLPILNRRHPTLVNGNISCIHLQSKLLYKTNYERSLKDTSAYWAEAAENLVWTKKWDKVIDNSNSPFTKWFTGGEISHCYNCIDRHVDEGNGDRVAIIHDSPVTDTIQNFTYNELLKQVSCLAGCLSDMGVKKGDRVLIYMPMIPQAVVAMQATIRLGGIHVVVFGGFAAKELSVRIDNCTPKAIISASCGVEPSRVVRYKPILNEALAMASHKPLKTIIYQRPNMEPAELGENDLDWDELMNKGRSHDCVPVPSNHPLYLLYTSGTTGLPKAVVRPTAGHSVRLHWSMKAIYGVDPGEVFWSASDLGWIVGHSYICHAPLVHGNATLMFEGKPVGTPDATTFFRIIQDHNVAALFVAPTALRAIKREDPDALLGKQFDLTSMRNLFVAGEHCDVDTLRWSKDAFQSPVLDHWWQTETGSAITASCVGLGNRLDPPESSTGLPVPGWDLRVVDDDGNEVERGTLGNIVAKLPLPLGTFQTLWNNDERFRNTYFTKYEGYYDTMDAGVQDEDGYISVMSRTDDVINVAGHRLSCGHIEEVINSHEQVVECAVVAKDDKLKGSIPFAYIVIKSDCRDPQSVLPSIIKLVRDEIGPVAAFKHAVFVNRLPKTRSGKTPRNTLQAICNKKPYKVSPTIEDSTVYPELEKSVSEYSP